MKKQEKTDAKRTVGRPKTLESDEIKKSCNIMLSLKNKEIFEDFCDLFEINKSEFLTLFIEKLIKNYVLYKDWSYEKNPEAKLFKDLIKFLKLEESSKPQEELKKKRLKKQNLTNQANLSRIRDNIRIDNAEEELLELKKRVTELEQKQ